MLLLAQIEESLSFRLLHEVAMPVLKDLIIDGRMFRNHHLFLSMLETNHTREIWQARFRQNVLPSFW